MLHQFIVVLLALFVFQLFTASVDAATYKVVGTTKDTDIAVLVNNKVYPLSVSNESSLLYVGTAPGGAPYRYVQVKRGTSKIKSQEPFERPAVADSETTVNQVYGRSWTQKEVKTFDRVDSLPVRYNRIDTTFHLQNEIPIIHVVAPESDIKKVHELYELDISINASMTYISANNIYQYPDSKFELSGRSSRLYVKPSYGIKLPKDGTDFGGYRKLKIRSLVTDPSYMREKLSYDMLRAAGVPATQASYVWLILNDQDMGLFMLEEKYDKTWLRNQFNAGKKPYKNGMLYRGEGKLKHGDRADLSYHGDQQDYYRTRTAYSIEEESEVGPKDFTYLINFVKFLDDQLKGPPENETLEVWNQHIDTEGAMINIVFEFLHGFCDGYVENTDNFYIYENPDENDRVNWISWDQDFIMGSGFCTFEKLILGDYMNFPGMTLRPFTKTFLRAPALRARFQELLKTIVLNIYQPEKSFPVIDSLVEFLSEDVARSRKLPPTRFGFSFVPFIGPRPLENILQKNSSDDTMSLPICLDLVVALDFVIRVNSDVSYHAAVEGPTGHVSLYPVKEWIARKTKNTLSLL